MDSLMDDMPYWFPGSKMTVREYLDKGGCLHKTLEWIPVESPDTQPAWKQEYRQVSMRCVKTGRHDEHETKRGTTWK